MESWRKEFYASDYGSQYLMHYRTKGSKNGISHTPGYKAIGEIAQEEPVNFINSSSANRLAGARRQRVPSGKTATVTKRGEPIHTPVGNYGVSAPRPASTLPNHNNYAGPEASVNYPTQTTPKPSPLAQVGMQKEIQSKIRANAVKTQMQVTSPNPVKKNPAIDIRYKKEEAYRDKLRPNTFNENIAVKKGWKTQEEIDEAKRQELGKQIHKEKQAEYQDNVAKRKLSELSEQIKGMGKEQVLAILEGIGLPVQSVVSKKQTQ